MFVLSELADVVKVSPWMFQLKLNEAVEVELNKKLTNKVVHNLGLCIALHDITKVEDSHVFPGDGSSHTKVYFRYIVFRPFMDEIIVGKIRSCSKEGVYVSLSFFDDILIPSDSLQHPSRFDETEQLWVWEYQTEDGSSHDLFMDAGEEVRFRVVDEIFVDTSPTGPTQEGAESIADTKESSKIPYTIIGSISESGLGLLSWWNS